MEQQVRFNNTLNKDLDLRVTEDGKDYYCLTVGKKSYVSEMSIDYWIFGHSHYNVDVKIGNTNCVSNQLGYVFHGEHESFNPGKYIEV